MRAEVAAVEQLLALVDLAEAVGAEQRLVVRLLELQTLAEAAVEAKVVLEMDRRAARVFASCDY
jgi:hypothetical protein